MWEFIKKDKKLGCKIQILHVLFQVYVQYIYVYGWRIPFKCIANFLISKQYDNKLMYAGRRFCCNEQINKQQATPLSHMVKRCFYSKAKACAKFISIILYTRNNNKKNTYYFTSLFYLCFFNIIIFILFIYFLKCFIVRMIWAFSL